jgi:ankyrin repeat protein
MRLIVPNCDVCQMNSSKALLAAADSNSRVVEILLDAGMDVNWKSSRTEADFNVWDLRDWDGSAASMTALHRGAIKGDFELVKLLLARGVRVNIKDNLGWLPAKRAREHGHMEVGRHLEGFGSRLNPLALSFSSAINGL